jgi:N-sulfoglucosamine sulfohydrolase
MVFLSPPMNRPNILYLHAHDAGRYVQPYGYAMETPNLMKFAKEGVLFRKAFCSAPTCSPSRAALLTGTTPHECGMWGLTTQGWQLNNYDRHLAQILSSALRNRTRRMSARGIRRQS